MRFFPRLVFSLFAIVSFGRAALGTDLLTGDIPAARDVDYPGTLILTVDASDVTRGIFQVSESMPVVAGPLALLYPQWLPGKHSPFGQASRLAGLTITAGGKPLAWRRDPIDVFAFHVEVPPGTTQLELRFQYLGATDPSQGRIVTTPDLLNLQWETVSLYPAGYFVSRIKVDASAKYPAGWKAATALEVADQSGATVHYRPVSYETLLDSPVFAGANFRTEKLTPEINLNVVADQPEQLAATAEQIQLHRNIVTQARKLFGAQHFDHYDFLLALSSRQTGIGIEHHRSSENGTEPTYFTDWKASLPDHQLISHEFTHSWNGKYRRPADLWTPDYRTPMQGSLLWVYEGQTEFWGVVLAARAGMVSKEDTLGSLASLAATCEDRVGRSWRPLGDTTNDPTMAQRRPQPWRSWQRAEDYYTEGLFIWLEADSLIRARSAGARSLDDFARSFFGGHDRDWGVVTYDFDDIVQALNRVEPYDWATFLHDRVVKPTAHAPLEGVTRGGYRLIYTDSPTDWFKATEKKKKILDLTFSGGFVLGKEGEISLVTWDSPAFNAGLTVGSKLIAVDGRALDNDQLKAAIKARKSPLSLLLKTGDMYRTVDLVYDGGLHYPRLEKTGGDSSSLDALLAPLP